MEGGRWEGLASPTFCNLKKKHRPARRHVATWIKLAIHIISGQLNPNPIQPIYPPMDVSKMSLDTT